VPPARAAALMTQPGKSSLSKLIEGAQCSAPLRLLTGALLILAETYPNGLSH
jgi:hypothetical protein